MIVCVCVCVCRHGFFWKIFDSSVGYKNESMVQHALMVGNTRTDGSSSISSGAMFAPQTEFWIGGPMTIVNYRSTGALSGCAEVLALVCRGMSHRSPATLSSNVLVLVLAHLHVPISVTMRRTSGKARTPSDGKA